MAPEAIQKVVSTMTLAWAISTPSSASPTPQFHAWITMTKSSAKTRLASRSDNISKRKSALPVYVRTSGKHSPFGGCTASIHRRK
jgi:hypothetical protein